MIASVFGGLRRRPLTALCVGLLTSVAAQAALAADCPGHPDAIGTSRTIVVDPGAHPIWGVYLRDPADKMMPADFTGKKPPYGLIFQLGDPDSGYAILMKKKP